MEIKSLTEYKCTKRTLTELVKDTCLAHELAKTRVTTDIDTAVSQEELAKENDWEVRVKRFEVTIRGKYPEFLANRILEIV